LRRPPILTTDRLCQTFAGALPVVTALLVFLAATPEPVNLDALNLERARATHGLVVASFLNAAPAHTVLGRTVIGPATCDDGAGRTAVLRDGRDADVGRRAELVG
jgi:hypothetical protein